MTQIINSPYLSLKRITGMLGVVTFWMTAGSGLASADACREKDSTPPMNVVVILADDMRWDAFGAGGSEYVHTPHLDTLAEDNVHFTNAYVTTSICNVSRASLLTGQYMSSHGLNKFGKNINPIFEDQTYAGLMRQAGYWSGYVGKDHISVAREDHFDFVRSYHGRHWYEVDGGRVHDTERNERNSLQFLKERPKDQPFLLNLNFFAPHAEDGNPKQYLPQAWSARHYQGVTIPKSKKTHPSYLKALPDFLSRASNEGRIRYDWRFTTPAHYQESMTNYFRLITEIDHTIGEVIKELKAQGVYGNTLIVFTGDNGYFHAERGLADKWYPYEESIRVPLIIHDPRTPAQSPGMQRDQIVLNIDIAPTILEAVGLTVPGSVQGVDLAPLYLGEVIPQWREEFLYEHPTISNKDRIPTSQAVVREDFKYVLWPEWDHEQLFDLRIDPTEKKNRVDDPEYNNILQTMRQRLDAWLDWAASPGAPKSVHGAAARVE